jgi:hypothetical protein
LFYYNHKTDNYSRFETLASKKWLSDKQLEYQQYLLKNVTQPLIEFIDHCVDYNPNTRYNAQQAADEYRKLLPIFKEHLKQNEIHKGLAGLHILNEANDLPIIPTPVKEPTPVKVPEPVPIRKENNIIAEAPPPIMAAKVKRKYTRKIKNISIVPKTTQELLNILNVAPYYINEDDTIVKIARALGSRKNFAGKTKNYVYKDILEKAKARNVVFV